MSGFTFPNSATGYFPPDKSAPRQGKPCLALLGAAGTVGQVTASKLAGKMLLTGFDIRPCPQPGLFDRWITGTAANKVSVFEAVRGADYVIQLFTGSGQGWDGVIDAEIKGTKNALEACIQHGVKRLVLLSSNHVTGVSEIEYYSGGVKALDKVRPTSMPRPDGLYGAAKLFTEGIARSACELTGLPVSIIRLGAMRLNDDPSKVLNGPRFAGQSESEYKSRMEAVWTTHEAWTDALLEELSSTDDFRLRYLPAGSPDAPWSGEIYTWKKP